MCSVELADNDSGDAQSRCSDPSLDVLYLQECNKCLFAYDNVCDEAGRGGTTDQCQAGTDSFDCFISDQTKQAITCADKATAEDLGLTAQILLSVALFASLGLPCVGCMGWFLPQCAQFKLTTIPLVSDLVFEVVRSRSLALVETTSVFLLIAGVAFDTQMCGSSFSLHPRKTTMACTDSPLPGVALSSIASFRESDEQAKAVLQALFILRFVFCNFANNQWQSIGKNLTGAALVIGIFVSAYSLILLSDDVSYCEFPMDVEQNFGSESHCYVYAPDSSSTFGLGGWKDRMSFREFMDGNASSSQLEGWEEWTKTEVDFYQLYSPTTITPTTELEFTEPKANDLLPSRRRVFVEQGGREMRLAARRLNQTSGMVNLDSTTESDGSDLGNTQPVSSMIEAIALYGEACESNERMRDSTLMSVTQCLLNFVEMFMLLSSILTIWSPAIPQPKAGCSRRCTASHAEATLYSIDFIYPIRMLGAVAVSMLLIAGAMSSIDYWASQTENQIVTAEAMYNEAIIPVLRGESVIAAPTCVAVHGPQDPDCSTAPGCASLPSLPLPSHAEATCSACFSSTDGEESCVTGEDPRSATFPASLDSACGNVPDTCRWHDDGECDAGSYCPDCTDVADCGPSARSWCEFQGDGAYGCRYIPQQLASSDIALIFNGLGIELAEEERAASVCEYENDGECDVTTYCPCGTDLYDCGVEILESDICRISYHNAYFDGVGGRLPPHEARPPFTKLDGDCDCSWFSLVLVQAHLLYQPVYDLINGYIVSQTDGGRRRMQSSRRVLQTDPVCLFGSCDGVGSTPCVDNPICSTPSYASMFSQAQASQMAVCELWTADIRATVAGMVQPPLPEGTLMEMLCPISCQSSSCNPEPEPEPGTQRCRYESDGECDVTTGICPAGTDIADCGSLEPEPEPEPQENRPPPAPAPPSTCRYENDGECDVATGVCPVATDVADCIGVGSTPCVDNPICSTPSYASMFSQAQASQMAVCELWTADIRATVAGMVQPPLPEGTLMEMLCPISCQNSVCTEPEPETQRCRYESDGECDVDTGLCPPGTDIADCGSLEPQAEPPPPPRVPPPPPDPPSTCRYENDGECDVATGVCPVGTDVADCENSAPPPPTQTSGCQYENDGECDAGTYCPAGTDVADCSGGTCEYENDGECDAGTYCPAGTDTADCYCPYENDGECDVPAFCPLHTDIIDCRGMDGGTMNMDDYCATIDANAEDCGDGSGQCCCKQGYDVQQGACVSANPWAKMQEIRDILQSPESARAFKCTLQYWRQYWEPLPFCIRYAGIIAVVIATASTVLYMLSFRKKAIRLRELVELYFDAETGWPKVRWAACERILIPSSCP